MMTPRAVPCRYLRMRPTALIEGGPTARKPISAAICDNAVASTYGHVLHETYDAEQWLKIETCRMCPQYLSIHP